MLKVSEDNGLQSGELRMWPRLSIFGSDFHDLGRGGLPVLDFAGTSIAFSCADETVMLFSLCLFYTMNPVFSKIPALLKYRLTFMTCILRNFVSVSNKCVLYSF